MPFREGTEQPGDAERLQSLLRISELGQNRKCLGRRGMSVSTQTEDIGTRTAQVPFVPRGDAKTIKKGIRARRRAGQMTIEACMASFVVALAT